MKIVVQNVKPRNPLIAPAKFRKAGSHTPKLRVARKDDRKLNT